MAQLGTAEKITAPSARPPSPTTQCSISTTTTRGPVPTPAAFKVPLSIALQLAPTLEDSLEIIKPPETLPTSPPSPSFPSNKTDTDGLFFKEITHRTALLLLDLTSTHQQLYLRNKNTFYKKYKKNLQKRGTTCQLKKISKKLDNLLSMYKRVKDRHKATGEGRKPWSTTRKQMDDLFGSPGIGSTPADTIYSTPLVLDEMSSQNVTTNTVSQPSFYETI